VGKKGEGRLGIGRRSEMKDKVGDAGASLGLGGVGGGEVRRRR
jgi:hypothetical protein